MLPYYTIHVYWCLHWYLSHTRVLCGGHCRKQVTLSALTCRSAPFALWDLADFGGQRNQGTSPSNPHDISHDSKGKNDRSVWRALPVNDNNVVAPPVP